MKIITANIIARSKRNSEGKSMKTIDEVPQENRMGGFIASAMGKSDLYPEALLFSARMHRSSVGSNIVARRVNRESRWRCERMTS